MKGYVSNIKELALENENFRKVLYTDPKSQLVLMSLLPGEEIGKEVHDVNQFLHIIKGTGEAILGEDSQTISDDSVIIIPAGTTHNVCNSDSGTMKLYSLYTPPHHKDGTIHKTKSEGEADDEHFDG